MLAEQLVGVVAVAVVEDGTIVRGEDHEGLLSQAASVQEVEELPHAPVGLDHRVPARPLAAGPLEARVRQARDVDVVGREHQEPGLAPPVLADLGRRVLEELQGLAHEDVGHVLVHPARRLATGHPADARDAVDDRAVVAVGPVLAQGVPRLLPARRGVDALAIADLDRVLGVEPHHAAVLEVDAGHAIPGRRHQEVVVEPEVRGVRPDLLVPVVAALTQAQVPLTDDARGVARGLEHVRQRDRVRVDHEPGVPGRDARALLAEGVLPREQGVARGRAGRRAAVGVGEAQPLVREPVDVRGRRP